MPLLPIRVLGPISECSRSITVIGQITGALVKVATISGNPIAQFTASWPEQSIEVAAGTLTASNRVIATQEFGGEVSELSATPEPVQPMPGDLTAYALRFPGPIYGCSGCIGVDGALPGAGLRVFSSSTGELLADTLAPDGYANVYLSRAIGSDESISAVQTA